MSGGVRQRPIADESELALVVARPVLGPAGNKTTITARSSSLLLPHHNKPLSKPLRSTTKQQQQHHPNLDKTSPPPAAPPSPPLQCARVPSILRRADLHSNLSLNASCSSDVSSDSRASTGKITTTGRTTTRRARAKQCISKSDKASVSDCDSVASSLDTSPLSLAQKRCAWVTSNTEPCYAAFHDEEWGVPVHDDKKLFELLVFSGALAELTWPTILMKRHIFREVFAEFDPVAVSKLNEKKISAPGSTARSLLSELKLRAIIENARQITKIIGEFGSFDKYMWSFVNYKPIVNKFRYPRQVPAKTSKADAISKELLRRGFRSVSVTVIYSFMQVAGITNDHLTTCFRYHQCTKQREDGLASGSMMNELQGFPSQEEEEEE